MTMTIDEAIRLLREDINAGDEGEPLELLKAEKLGIEALQRIKQSRGEATRYYIGYLPGETKEPGR